MEKENIDVKELIATCRGGSEVSNCIREAIIMSLEEMRQVKINHNDRIYSITPQSVINYIYNQNEKTL